jgi:23S rRNA (cytosine1962-C5)-methyltransferase
MKTKRELSGAIRGYKELNLTAMKVLNENGTLCTFSCSHNMPNEIFADIIKKAAHDARKKITVLKRCRQAPDHPIIKAIPETEYLKGYFLKVASA